MTWQEIAQFREKLSSSEKEEFDKLFFETLLEEYRKEIEKMKENHGK